ncbi:MAG: amidohydrolase family protein [Bryobacteraceae bacterium]|jgi:imidazolonepropionase-like amidohydrolase
MKWAVRACLLICVYSRSFAANNDLLIRNITLIDVATGTATPSRSILIHNAQIASIGPPLHVPLSTRIIDASGKFVIPGLWDMHVHLTAREQLPAYLRYGITGVRDMGSDYDRVNVWRGEIQKGSLIGPHIETCGPALDGVPSGDPKRPVRVVRTPEEARTIFNQLDDESVDFIGILPQLPRDAYFALIERARKYYLAVAGDVPAPVSALEAVEARQKSIDHMSGILLACSSEEKRLRQAYVQALESGDREALADVRTAAIESFAQQKAATLFGRMALFETRLVPTLAEPHEKLLDMLRAGVVILAGTDGGKPGESLHDELELLVAAGLTPAQALRSATLEPARYLDALSLGTVEEGKTADLVILDTDPLADIRNTRKIAAVILGGKYLTHAYLQRRP